MNHTRNNPVGVDLEIQRIQDFLYENLSDKNIEGFGRAELQEGKPMVFYKKNDYKEVLFVNPNTAGKFFFIDSDRATHENGFCYKDLDLYFLLNIAKLKPETEYRYDEEIAIEMVNLLKTRVLKIKEVKGQEALKDFDTNLVNMQPYMFLKFTFQISYQTFL